MLVFYTLCLPLPFTHKYAFPVNSSRLIKYNHIIIIIIVFRETVSGLQIV